MTVSTGHGISMVSEVEETQSRLLTMDLNRTGVLARPWPAASRRSGRRRSGPGRVSSVQDQPPTGLTRALTFIERHAADHIGLVEIAAAAGLSPRALQAAFHRHLDTTPLRHLRSVRLAHAHADLRSARAGDGRTVSTVASSWQFSQLSRFARDYRRRYGVAPHQTLGTGAP